MRASSSRALHDEKRQFDLPAFVLSELAAVGVGGAEWIGYDT